MLGEVRAYIGKIAEVRGDGFVKVAYSNLTSDFYPYLRPWSSFKMVKSPPQMDEIVVLFRLDRLGFVLGNIAPKDEVMSVGEHIVFSDGLEVTYNENVLSIKNAQDLSIEVSGSVSVKCESVSVECESAKVEAQGASVVAQKVELGGEGLAGTAGVVTGECVCPFTGSPHADISAVVLAKKA